MKDGTTMENLNAPFIKPNATVVFSQEGDGWLFGYASSDVTEHVWYAQASGLPFPTREAAKAVALDEQSENLAEWGTGVQIWSVK